MLLRAVDVLPAIHRAAGNALEHHDVAGAAVGQRREDEILADRRDQVEVDGRVVRARRHAVHIGQRQRALRLVEGRLFGVALEQLRDVALAGGDDGQVGRGGVGFEVGDAGLLDLERAAAALELLPSRPDI